MIPGDGIGKEVTAEALKVLSGVGETFGRTFELEHLPWSADHFLKTGETLPPTGYDLLRQFDAVFIGALGDPPLRQCSGEAGTRNAPADWRRPHDLFSERGSGRDRMDEELGNTGRSPDG